MWPGRVRDFDLALEHRDGSALLGVVDPDVELGALEAGVDVRRAEAERPRVAADHVDHAAEQLEKGADAVVGLHERQRGVLVDPDHALVGQTERRATVALHAYRVAEADHGPTRGRRPAEGAGALHLDLAFDREQLGMPLVASARGCLRLRRRGERRPRQRNQQCGEPQVIRVCAKGGLRHVARVAASHQGPFVVMSAGTESYGSPVVPTPAKL